MAAFDQILTVLAGDGWGMVTDDAHLTVWSRKTPHHTRQAVEIYWTAQRHLHHAWVISEGVNGSHADARFDNIEALVTYIKEGL